MSHLRHDQVATAKHKADVPPRPKGKKRSEIHGRRAITVFPGAGQGTLAAVLSGFRLPPAERRSRSVRARGSILTPAGSADGRAKDGGCCLAEIGDTGDSRPLSYIGRQRQFSHEQLHETDNNVIYLRSSAGGTGCPSTVPESSMPLICRPSGMAICATSSALHRAQ